MGAEQRERIADLAIAGGAVALFVSLFLTWSHQLSPAFATEWSATPALHGVPPDATAWQAYTVADGILALVAVALLAASLRGGRAARLVLLAAALLGLAFVLHAMAVPPTDGTNVAPPFGTPGYVANAPTSGTGEVVALVALGLAALGLTLSFTAD